MARPWAGGGWWDRWVNHQKLWGGTRATEWGTKPPLLDIHPDRQHTVPLGRLFP